jgi:hypothetical protein
MAGGDEASRLGDYPKAVQNYERATQLKGNDATAQRRLADAQHQRDSQGQAKIEQPRDETGKPAVPSSALDQLDKELTVWEVMLGSKDPSPEIVYIGEALKLLRSPKSGVQAEKIKTDMGRSGRQFVKNRLVQMRALYDANGWLDNSHSERITGLLQRLPNFQ